MACAHEISSRCADLLGLPTSALKLQGAVPDSTFDNLANLGSSAFGRLEIGHPPGNEWAVVPWSRVRERLGLPKSGGCPPGTQCFAIKDGVKYCARLRKSQQ